MHVYITYDFRQIDVFLANRLAHVINNKTDLRNPKINLQEYEANEIYSCRSVTINIVIITDFSVDN